MFGTVRVGSKVFEVGELLFEYDDCAKVRKCTAQKKQYAIKIRMGDSASDEDKKTVSKSLKTEKTLLEWTNKVKHPLFPTLISSSSLAENLLLHHIVYEVCTGNLRTLQGSTNRTTDYTMLLQMYESVTFLHKNRWLVNILRPESFCVYEEGKIKLSYLECASSMGDGILPKNRFSRHFSSLAVDKGRVGSEAADLESLYYLAHFVLGRRLPWKHMNCRDTWAEKRLFLDGAYDEQFYNDSNIGPLLLCLRFREFKYIQKRLQYLIRKEGEDETRPLTSTRRDNGETSVEVPVNPAEH